MNWERNENVWGIVMLLHSIEFDELVKINPEINISIRLCVLLNKLTENLRKCIVMMAVAWCLYETCAGLLMFAAVLLSI